MIVIDASALAEALTGAGPAAEDVRAALSADLRWELRGKLTAYGAAYVAAAEALDCPLVTADGKLARATGPRCEIRLVAAA